MQEYTLSCKNKQICVFAPTFSLKINKTTLPRGTRAMVRSVYQALLETEREVVKPTFHQALAPSDPASTASDLVLPKSDFGLNTPRHAQSLRRRQSRRPALPTARKEGPPASSDLPATDPCHVRASRHVSRAAPDLPPTGSTPDVIISDMPPTVSAHDTHQQEALFTVPNAL